MLAITDAQIPIFDVPGNPTKSCFALLKKSFTDNSQSQTDTKICSCKPRANNNSQLTLTSCMAGKADLAKAMAEDLIVVMGIVGCKDDELRGDLQKLEAPKLEDIKKLGEAFQRKTFAAKGFTVQVNAVQTSVRKKEIEHLMKGKCCRCGEGHLTDQCSQKGSSLKCMACNRKGHIAQACYTEMLMKYGTV